MSTCFGSSYGDGLSIRSVGRNVGVLVNNQDLPLGTRVADPFPRQVFRRKGFSKVLSISPYSLLFRTMAPSFRKHWKPIQQAKQNLYGLPFKTSKKKWSWFKVGNTTSGDQSFQKDPSIFLSSPFKQEYDALGNQHITNALSKSIRYLAPLRREYGFYLRAKQALKASHGLLSESRSKSLAGQSRKMREGK
jgi:hypothetical protein